MLSAQERMHGTIKGEGFVSHTRLFPLQIAMENSLAQLLFFFPSAHACSESGKNDINPVFHTSANPRKTDTARTDEKMHRPKPPPNHKRRMETILNQFRKSMHAGHGKKSERTFGKRGLSSALSGSPMDSKETECYKNSETHNQLRET
jgi:hypothetical protein